MARRHDWARGIWALFAYALLGACFATAQELEPYLKTRAAHKIKGATPIAALELAVGKRVLEVEGVVVGSVAVGEEQSVLMEIEPGRSIVVAIGAGHGWLTRGQVRIRAIVEVQRESELVTPTYRLLSATFASTIAKWEAQQRALQQAKAQAQARTPKPPATRPPSRGADLNSRANANAARAAQRPNPAPDWDTFRANLHLYQPEYARFIRSRNPRLSQQQADQIAWAILRFSAHYGVDPRFIVAIVLVEWASTPAAPRKNGGGPPYRETQNYVRKVIRVYKQLCGIRD